MIKKAVLVIVVTLVCFTAYFSVFVLPMYIVTRPDILYIGDSLCEATHDGMAPTLASYSRIAKDCLGGRKSIEYGDLPDNKTVIFYALGSNDHGETPLETYIKDLEQKVSGTSSPVICVLPDHKKTQYEGIRNAMKSVCLDTIEPREHGYHFRAKDGIHGTAADHRRFGKWLAGYIKTNYPDS